MRTTPTLIFTSPIGPHSQCVVSLAGHIDHGKSALVRALTGGAVDRLSEEKRRGITIDLGFSHFDANGFRFALIDVPGHERFIHTMVAGASGVDVALLAIAADDSVMPQTREHLSVLELLDVRRGVIAITKCDLADDEQLEMVDLEVADLVAGTFLAEAPRIKVSTVSGRGIAELRQSLVDAARLSASRRTNDPPFRLPIDRAFSLTGQGTVVTGSVWRGTARIGDTLHLLPARLPVRVKRLQSQGVDVETVYAGERAAINLVGVKASAIRRGDELTTPDAYSPALRLLAQARILPDAGQPLRHRQLVRIHLGANQATAQVLMGQREVAPGQTAFAVLRCKTPMVAEFGQPFVMRRLSPAATIGGGTIVAPALRDEDRLKRSLAAAQGLSDADPGVRLTAYIDLCRETTFDEAIESRVGLNRAQCDQVAAGLQADKTIVRTGGTPPRFMTTERFLQLKQQMVRRCQIELELRRPALRIPLSVILSAMSHRASAPALAALLEDMTARGELVLRGDRVGLPTGAELSHRQRRMLDTLISECADAGQAPPTLKELAQRHGYSLPDLEGVVQVAVDDGRLVRLSSELAIDPNALEALRLSLADYFQEHSTAKIGDIRQRWGMTRKHAVPIFEFFDHCGITTRVGDAHSAGPRMSSPIDEVVA